MAFYDRTSFSVFYLGLMAPKALPVLSVCLSVCLSLQPWHQRTLHPIPTPQNRGTCSIGLETGCKPVLLYLQWKVERIIEKREQMMDKEKSNFLDVLLCKHPKPNYSHFKVAWNILSKKLPFCNGCVMVTLNGMEVRGMRVTILQWMNKTS